MTSTATPTIADIAVEDIEYPGLGTMLTVTVLWEGVDRPNVGGMTVKDAKMADRLVRAIRAGVAYPNPRIVRDNAGKTYVHTDRAVMAKYLHADLKRLGF